MATFDLSINGRPHQVQAPPDMPLLWVMRDLLGLTGTKFGCGLGVCGSCTLLVEGVPLRACQLPVSEVGARAITSIEGLSEHGDHPVQKAWLACDVAQCGYCQPGMIMEACALLKAHPSPTEAQVDDAFAEHVCRCGTYGRIRQAVAMAAGQGGVK